MTDPALPPDDPEAWLRAHEDEWCVYVAQAIASHSKVVADTNASIEETGAQLHRLIARADVNFQIAKCLAPIEIAKRGGKKP